MYLYPENLTARPMLWLWTLRDVAWIGTGLLLSVLALTQTGSMIPLVITAALTEVLDTSLKAFTEKDVSAARLVEPLEQVIDELRQQLRTRHILRMKKGECSIEAGFVWSDLLTNLERVSDHCSNVALCVLDMKKHNLNVHETQHERETEPEFIESYRSFAQKYALD